ncbi:MAG: choice-of-anchor D domain-containing protein [Spirochaetota bacterium]
MLQKILRWIYILILSFSFQFCLGSPKPDFEFKTILPFFQEDPEEVVAEISLKQSSTQIASGGSYNFGSVRTGNSSTKITFTIANTGTADLSLGAMPSLSGTNSSEYTLDTSETTTKVAPGASTDFSLVFTPTATGVRNAAIIINSNDTDEETYTLYLTGTGTTTDIPEINITDGSTSIANGGNYDFGSVVQGRSSATTTFTIENKGTATLNLSSVPILSGANSSEFTIDTSSLATAIASANSTTYTVIFHPTSSGTKAAVVTIPSNDSDESSYVINLTGTGAARPEPEINVKQNTADIVRGGSYDFGSITQSTSSAAITFTIENSGTADLNLTGTPKVRIRGANPNDFAIDETATAFSISASGETTFTVTFTPITTGARSATIAIFNDDTDEGIYAIDLIGTGTAAGDTTQPTVGGGAALVTSSVRPVSLVLSWTGATDDVSKQDNLAYQVYYSTLSNIATVADAEANGTIAQAYTTNIQTSTIAGLSPGTQYFLNVVVRDEAGNKSVYTTVSVTTAIRYLSSGTPWGANNGDGSSDNGNREFSKAFGIAIGASSNVYVVDKDNHRIQKFDSTGNYLSQWGSNGTGNGQFSQPTGIAIDGNGDILVADSDNHRIQKFTSAGVYISQWGSDGTGNGQFSKPNSIAIDRNGNIYVTDTDNHRIQKFASSGTYLTKWGSNGNGNGQFDGPKGIAIDASGTIYVADENNHRIQKFDSAGNYLSQWGSNGTNNGRFDKPYGLVYYHGSVYVCDSNNHRMQIFNDAGTHLYTLGGTSGTATGEFDKPMGIAVSATGKLYITEESNNRVQVFE